MAFALHPIATTRHDIIHTLHTPDEPSNNDNPQKLRVKLAEALDDEAGAKMAAELGILADEEAEETKVERLDYLRKVRLLFLQGGSPGGVGASVDEGGLLLCLLACLREEVLLDLDGDVVRQLDAVLSGELPRAKGWKRLAAQVEALARRPDVRCCIFDAARGGSAWESTTPFRSFWPSLTTACVFRYTHANHTTGPHGR